MTLLNPTEAAARLHISKSSLYKWTSARTVPHLKIGGKVWFDQDTLDAWVAGHAVGVLS